MLKIECDGHKGILSISGKGTMLELFTDVSMILCRLYESFGSEFLKVSFSMFVQMIVDSGFDTDKLNEIMSNGVNDGKDMMNRFESVLKKHTDGKVS